MLKTANEDDAQSKTCVCDWFSRSKNGASQLRFGRSATSRTDDDVEKIYNFLYKDFEL